MSTWEFFALEIVSLVSWENLTLFLFICLFFFLSKNNLGFENTYLQVEK